MKNLFKLFFVVCLFSISLCTGSVHDDFTSDVYQTENVITIDAVVDSVSFDTNTSAIILSDLKAVSNSLNLSQHLSFIDIKIDDNNAAYLLYNPILNNSHLLNSRWYLFKLRHENFIYYNQLNSIKNHDHYKVLIPPLS